MTIKPLTENKVSRFHTSTSLFWLSQAYQPLYAER